MVSLTNTLVDALARASRDDLGRCAEQRSTTDELRQIGIRVEATTDVLAALAGLARRAQASDQRLHCWWALCLTGVRLAGVPARRSASPAGAAGVSGEGENLGVVDQASITAAATMSQETAACLSRLVRGRCDVPITEPCPPRVPHRAHTDRAAAIAADGQPGLCRVESAYAT